MWMSAPLVDGPASNSSNVTTERPLLRTSLRLRPSAPCPAADSQRVPPLIILNTQWCTLVNHSRLYAPECNHLGTPPPRPLLITGTGRSGTTYMVKLFKEVGFPIDHDVRSKAGRNWLGAASWPHTFLPTAFGCQSRFKKHHFVRIVHLVRNPLNTIISRWNGGARHTPAMVEDCFLPQHQRPSKDMAEKDRLLAQSLRHWVLHNSFAEAQAEGRVNLEAIRGETVAALLSDLDGVPHNPPVDAASFQRTIDAMQRNVNSNHTKKPPTGVITWARLESVDPDYARMAAMMALRYGYGCTLSHTTRAEALNDPRVMACWISRSTTRHHKWQCQLVLREPWTMT